VDVGHSGHRVLRSGGPNHSKFLGASQDYLPFDRAFLDFPQTHPKLGLDGCTSPPSWRNPPKYIMHMGYQVFRTLVWKQRETRNDRHEVDDVSGQMQTRTILHQQVLQVPSWEIYAHQTPETEGEHIIPVGITAVQFPHYSISHHSQTHYILMLLAPRH
jgi:hypothetical protein